MISPRWVGLFRDIQDEHKINLGLSILRGIALFLSFFYYVYVYGFKLAISLGLIPLTEFSIPVISVGNITLGGTGKTSLVEYLAEYIKRKLNLRVCIISRGYGAPNLTNVGDIVQVVESDSHGINKDWRDVGDEAFLLAAHLPNVPIVVSNNKVKACTQAVKELAAQVIILDDGFQTSSIKKNLDIVMLSAEKPFGNKCLLPRGILREPVQNLERAQVVLMLDNAGKQNIPLLKEYLDQYFVFSYIGQARYMPTSIKGLNVDMDEELSSLRESKVMAVCGLGNPHSFYQTLQEAGITLIKTMSYPDHYPYNEDDMQMINGVAKGARADFIITSEKDALKMPILKGPYVPVLVLQTSFEIDEPKAFLELLTSTLHLQMGQTRLEPKDKKDKQEELF